MCKCNPNIRTPFCGAAGCGWDEPETPIIKVLMHKKTAQLLLWDGGDECFMHMSDDLSYDLKVTCFYLPDEFEILGDL